MVRVLTTLHASIYCPYIPESKMYIEEKRLHGAKYFVVRPVFANWQEMEKWTTKIFGEPASCWDEGCQRWYMNDQRFWFRNEADRTMFILRWA
jgi:hypothetical protein